MPQHPDADLLRRTADLLDAIQWDSWSGGAEEYVCPSCGQMRLVGRHDADCELIAIRDRCRELTASPSNTPE